MATLRIIRSYPGSGKTSFAHRMFPGTLLIENDQYHMHDGVYDWHAENMKDAIAWCGEMVRAALEKNADVCVANTFTKKRFIEHYAKLAEEYGAKLEVYRCTGNFKNVHGLSEKMVDGFKKSMEDWPGETIVTPIVEPKMRYEVFNAMSNETIAQFSDISLADMFIAGMPEDMAAEVQIKKIEKYI